MKNVLLCLLVCALLPLSAQITLDSNDFPKAGDTPTFSLGDTLLNIDLDQTGPNFVWDFSNLSPLAQNTDSFIRRSDIPIGLRLQIPSRVNVAGYINTPDSIPGAGISLSGGYDLYAVSAGAYESLGQGTVLGGFIGLVLEKEPSDTIFSLPLNYQDSREDSSYADVDVNLLTLGEIYYEQSRTRQYTVDGWGQLTTPYGQFQVLRTRSAVQGSDSTRIVLGGGDTTAFRLPIPLQISYEWWAKGERAPILQINAASLGGNEFVTQVRYRDSVRSIEPPTSIDRELEQQALSISPNPASDFTTIRWDMQGKPGFLEIFDTQGKQLLSRHLRSREAGISVAELDSGNYLLRIVELGGKRVFLGKLTVQ